MSPKFHATKGDTSTEKSMVNVASLSPKRPKPKKPKKTPQNLSRRNISSSNSKGSTNSSILDSNTTEITKSEDFASKAKELKADILQVIDRQIIRQSDDQLIQLTELKKDLVELSKAGLDEDVNEQLNDDPAKHSDSKLLNQSCAKQSTRVPGIDDVKLTAVETNDSKISGIFETDNILAQALDKLCSKDVGDDEQKKDINRHSLTVGQSEPGLKSDQGSRTNLVDASDKIHCVDGFELLHSLMDPDSKLLALMSSLKSQFDRPDDALETVCRKLVDVSDHNGRLRIRCDEVELENNKSVNIRLKLENLCRELQKSNHLIRIDSLELIKAEQSKAREQTTKIQSTLSSVIKLFDDNQQRNMALRQENHELQTRLKSLLDHCDNWEKSVNTSLRQRDIENRLLKTELAKANLIQNQEREKSLVEKQAMMQVLSKVEEQRTRIEGQEAKLRSDLTNYASKYDECQAVISQGMSKFESESKRMLSQIQRSKTDYKALLAKYESTTSRMAQLLEEKQRSDQARIIANKKIDTLERLCRALNNKQNAFTEDISQKLVTSLQKSTDAACQTDYHE